MVWKCNGGTKCVYTKRTGKNWALILCHMFQICINSAEKNRLCQGLWPSKQRNWSTFFYVHLHVCLQAFAFYKGHNPWHTLFNFQQRKCHFCFVRLSDEKKSVITIDNSGRQLLEYEDVVLDEDSTLVIMFCWINVLQPNDVTDTTLNICNIHLIQLLFWYRF